MQVFRDATGRPGPSTWEVGDYPQGHDDYPVNGVSWYEAAAYAEFAGKQLPTIYHWQQAASPGFFAAIVELSNFSSTGPARVGSHNGIGAFGTLDMAGNVREWCWNEIGGQRYVRGGAWNEQMYLFAGLDARLPWDRSAQNGIRCVRYDAGKESGLQAPVTRPVRDYSKETTGVGRGVPAVSQPLRLRFDGPRCACRGHRRGELVLETREDLLCGGLRKRARPRLFLHPEACDPAVSDDPLCGPRHVDAITVAAAGAGTVLPLPRQERAGVPASGAQGPVSAPVCCPARRSQRDARPADSGVQGLPPLRRVPGEPSGRGSRPARRLRIQSWCVPAARPRRG